MELKRLARLLRDRWMTLVILALLGAAIAVLATDWTNRRIQPHFEATAPVTFLGDPSSRSAEGELQAVYSLALLANSELMASNDRLSIDSNEDTSRILFTAESDNAEEAKRLSLQMREAFHQADPRNEEPLIQARLDEIVAELEVVDSQMSSSSDSVGSLLRFDDEIVIAQIAALRQRLSELAEELANTPEPTEERAALEAEMTTVGAQIAELEEQLLAIGPDAAPDISREESLQQSALEIYAADLVSEYQTLYLRLLGRNPTTRDEAQTTADLTASRRDLLLMGGLGLIAGALMGVVAIIGLDTLRRPLWTRRDGMAVGAHVVELPPRRPIRSGAESWYPQAPPAGRKRGVQTVRTLVSVDSAGPTSVALVDMGAGQQQVAVLTADLGAALAAAGKSVLAIDANFEKAVRVPDLAAGTNRLADILTIRPEDEEELRSAVKRAMGDQVETVSGMRVLPAGELPGDQVDALAGRQLAVLLQEANTMFDTVLVALPPLGHPSTDGFTNVLDDVLLVGRAGRTRLGTLQGAIAALGRRHANLVGTALLVGRKVRPTRVSNWHRNRYRRGSGRHLPSARSWRRKRAVSARPDTGAGPADRANSLPIRFLRKSAKTVFAAADLARRRPPGPRILLYHQIGSGSRLEMNIKTDMFRRQLDWLEKQGEIVALEEALMRLKEPANDRLFVLTFDDGYEDMYNNAFPILLERRLPFTLYLTTHPVDSGEPLSPQESPLNWQQVRDMLSSGLLTLGSHTHSHPDLRHVDGETVASELDTSGRLLATEAGVRVRHFAYPKGYWSDVADPLVRERFLTATLGAGGAVTDSTDPYCIHRVPVQRSDGMFFFKRKMKKGMRLEERMRRRLRGYKGVGPLPLT